MSGLEPRPDRTSDRLAIYELYARYAWAVDLLDGTAYAECFTEDGWTDISSFGNVEGMRAAGLTCVDETGRVRGRENLRTIATKRPGTQMYRHVTANPLVTALEGDRATGTASFLVLSPTGEIHQYGRYEDVVARGVDGCWRFAERMDLALFNRGSTLV